MINLIKTILSSLTSIIIATTIISCGNAKTGASAGTADSAKWRGLEAYHHVMSRVYHPYMEEKTLTPLHSLSDSLVIEADLWAADPLPSRLEGAEMQASLEQLKAETHKLADSVKARAGEASLGKQLSVLHEHFHHIMNAWNAGKEEVHKEH